MALVGDDEFSSPGKQAPQAPQKPAQGSYVNSALRGLQQGATLGQSDEMNGHIGAGAKAVGALITFAGSKNDKESYDDAYRRIRDADRAVNANAKAANPITYGVAEVIGSLIPSMLVKSPTAVGGLAANGNSNQDAVRNPGALTADTGVGAAAGHVLGKVATGMGTKPADIGVKQHIKDSAGNASFPKTEKTIAALSGVSGGTTGLVHGGPVGGYFGAKGGYEGGKKVAEKVTTGLGAGKGAVESMPSEVKTLVRPLASQDPANSVTSWVRQTLGFDTPSGQQNMPASMKDGMKEDAEAVQRGEKNGRPAPEVPNIIVEDGKSYMVTPSGARVSLD